MLAETETVTLPSVRSQLSSPGWCWPSPPGPPDIPSLLAPGSAGHGSPLVPNISAPRRPALNDRELERFRLATSVVELKNLIRSLGLAAVFSGMEDWNLSGLLDLS